MLQVSLAAQQLCSNNNLAEANEGQQMFERRPRPDRFQFNTGPVPVQHQMMTHHKPEALLNFLNLNQSH